MSFGFGLAFPHWQILSGGAFSPASLFAAGEQGAWYDPSDFLRYMSELGSEEILNGTFDTNTSGWVTVSTNGSVLTQSDGQGIFTNANGLGGTTDYFTQAPVLAAGRVYQVSLTAPVGAQVRVVQNYSPFGTVATFNVTQPNQTFVFTTTLSGAYGIRFFRNTAPSPAAFDNISVREVTGVSTATLFQESTGLTPVTAVEQPVGLMLDKSKGLVLGSERVTNGNFSNELTGWTAGGGAWAATGGAAVFTGTGAFISLQQAGVFVAGRTYEVLYSLTVNSGAPNFNLWVAGSQLVLSGPASGNAGIGVRRIVTASVSGSLFMEGGNTGAFTLDNVSVRELPGNHATQSSTTKRPTLSARYNLLTRTEEFNDAVWANTATITANAGTAPDGSLTADLITPTANDQFAAQTVATGSPVGRSFTFSVWLRADTPHTATLSMFDNVAAERFSADVTVTTSWQRFSVTGTWTVGTGSVVVQVFPKRRLSGDPNLSVLAWGADLRVANDALGQPAYQRVTTATDYDTAGFLPYLRFDGTDDAMATASIDFSATDKMTVFAGVRKLSDAAAAIVAELSASTGDNAGSFLLAAPATAAANYGWNSRGSSLPATLLPTTYAAPITNALTGIGNISGDSAVIRVNGVQAASGSADQGTGNFGNYPLFLGARNQTSLYFNGRLYSLIVRGAETSATLIAATESWVNRKTGAY